MKRTNSSPGPASNPSAPAGAEDSPGGSHLAPRDPEAEELFVGAFLSQMGPGEVPAALVQRITAAVQHELAASSAAEAPWSWDRGALIGLGWALDAPRLALGGVLSPPGARQTLAGLSTVGYALSFLQGPAPHAPKRRKYKVARFLLRLGAKR